MYIGSTGLAGLHHLVWEVVDNSVDEAMAGYCTRIDVTLLADGGCRVDDNGRGIPVDPYPSGPHKGKSAAEVVLTVLHAGGKFGGDGYKVSGGLHGVGVSGRQRAVRAARSSRSTATASATARSTPRAASRRARCEVVGDDAGARPHRHDRHVLARPDDLRRRAPSSSPAPCSSGCRRWRSSTGASRSCFTDERAEHRSRRSRYQYKGGIVDFVKHLNASKEPLFSKVVPLRGRRRRRPEVDIAIQWNTGYYEGIHCFANGIATTEGGMHVEGFKTALTHVVNKYARAKNLLKEKDDNLLGEDIREGLTAIISVKLRDPQFEGQTKAKLGNVPMRSFVAEGHQRAARRVARGEPDRGQQDRQEGASPRPRPASAAKNARNAIRRKTRSSGAGMPDKLKDCSSAATPTSASCSSSRATPPAAPPSTPATRAPRRSCRSAARSSTSSGPASTRC